MPWLATSQPHSGLLHHRKQRCRSLQVVRQGVVGVWVLVIIMQVVLHIHRIQLLPANDT
jgi:hypothetical protein